MKDINAPLMDEIYEGVYTRAAAILNGEDDENLPPVGAGYAQSDLKLHTEKVVISAAMSFQGKEFVSSDSHIFCGDDDPDPGAFLAVYGDPMATMLLTMANFVARFKDRFPGIKAAYEITIPVDSKQQPKGMSEGD